MSEEASTEIVVSRDIELPEKPLIHNGEPVITLAMMDRFHGRTDGTARRNFNQHRGKMREGAEFFELKEPYEIRSAGIGREQGGTADKVVLLSESGYLLLVKSFRDDLAWDVQRKLVSEYFRSKSLQTQQQCADYAPLAKMITDGLMPVVKGLADGQTEIREEIGKVKDRVAGVELAVRDLARSERRHVSGRDKNRHINFIYASGGKCPCCRTADVVDQFCNRIDGAEYDHFYNRRRNKANETWLVCGDCHDKLDSDKYRSEKHDSFRSYTVSREEYEQRRQPVLPFGEATA